MEPSDVHLQQSIGADEPYGGATSSHHHASNIVQVSNAQQTEKRNQGMESGRSVGNKREHIPAPRFASPPLQENGLTNIPDINSVLHPFSSLPPQPNTELPTHTSSKISEQLSLSIEQQGSNISPFTLNQLVNRSTSQQSQLPPTSRSANTVSSHLPKQPGASVVSAPGASPISAPAQNYYQESKTNSSTATSTAVESRMGARSGPSGSSMGNEQEIVAQPSSTSSTSPTSQTYTPVSGPSSARMKYPNLPTQPIGILKPQHARRPSGSSLNVSTRIPSLNPAENLSSAPLSTPAFPVHPHPILTSSSSNVHPISQLVTTQQSTASSVISPQSTTTASSISAFAFSPHPGSTSSSAATSPAYSPTVTGNAEMTYPSIQTHLENAHKYSSIKSQGKQREVVSTGDLSSATGTTPDMSVASGHRPLDVGLPIPSSTSTTSGTRSNTSTPAGPYSIPSGARSGLAQSLYQGTPPSSGSPLQQTLRSSISSSSLSSRHTSASSTKAKMSRVMNPTTFGPPPASSSNSNNQPSTSSSKSPIPFSWASRPVDLNSQRPAQTHQQGSALSHSRSLSQTPLISQQLRSRVSNNTGTNSTSVTTSVSVLAYGNHNRTGSGGGGLGGSRNVMGARARSHSRTRTKIGMMSVVAPSGRTSSASREASRERDMGSGALSLKSISVPSTPVMKSTQASVTTGLGSGASIGGTNSNPPTPLSLRLPRALPSPVLPSKSLNAFGRDASPAKLIPKQAATFDQIVIAGGSGHAARRLVSTSPATPSALMRPQGRREPSLPRHIVGTSTRNTSPSPARLHQPSLAAHIASLSASPPTTSNFVSSMSTHIHPPRSTLAGIPQKASHSIFTSTDHLNLPSITTSSASPISPSLESSHQGHLSGLLPNDLDGDDDKSSLSSFRAASRGDSHSGSDLEGDGSRVVGQDDELQHEVYDHRDGEGYVDGYCGLSRSPSPIRYAKPDDSEGLFSSDDEDFGLRRGRRGRGGRAMPGVIVAGGVVADSDTGQSEGADGEAEDGLGDYASDGEVRRGRKRRTQPRAFRHSYRHAPIVDELELSGKEVGKDEVVGEDVGDVKGSDRLWKISRTKTKAKTKDGDLDKVVKAKDKAKKAKSKRSYFDFDFGAPARSAPAHDDSGPSSIGIDNAFNSRESRETAETAIPYGALRIPPLDTARRMRDSTIFDISSSQPNSTATTSSTSHDQENTTTDSSPSLSAHSPHIASQSSHGHSTYRSNINMADRFISNTSFTSASHDSVPYTPPTAPFLSRRSDLANSAPSSPLARSQRIDYQQNSAYALEMETHGISCGFGSPPTVQRGSKSGSAQSSQDVSGYSSSKESSSGMFASKSSAPFSVFGLSRRGSTMFRDKERDNGGVKLKDKNKKTQRSAGTSSTGSSQKGSSLASLLIEAGVDNHDGPSGRT